MTHYEKKILGNYNPTLLNLQQIRGVRFSLECDLDFILFEQKNCFDSGDDSTTFETAISVVSHQIAICDARIDIICRLQRANALVVDLSPGADV